ncbi:MAG: PQQ-binding-like beta-propeller repeat protein [Spirochaetes bacterium]|nr:PQQ-binding-like beta-propeller repeat protein [Spirochaetota bacterium]
MANCTIKMDKWVSKAKDIQPGIKKPSVSTPVMDAPSGKIYLPLKQGHPYSGAWLKALDVSDLTVKTVWEDLVCSSVLVTEDKLFMSPINLGKKRLICLNKNDYSVLWIWNDVIRASSNMNPSVGKSDDSIIVADMDGHVYCVDEASQKTNWHYKCPVDKDASRSNFYIENNRLYFGTSKGPSIICLDMNTGKSLWEYGGQEKYTGGVLNFCDNALAAQGSASLMILDKMTGKALADIPYSGYFGRNENDEMIYTPFQPCADYPFLYINDIEKGLVCYRYDEGSGLEIQWSFKPENSLTGAFHILNDKILCATGDTKGKNNKVHLLEKDSGVELLTAKTKELAFYIVPCDNRFFLFSSNGQIELAHVEL